MPDFPLWFKLFLGLFLWTMVTGTIRRLKRSKYVEIIKAAPAKSRNKIMKVSSKILLISKIFLFCAPLNLIALPYILYYQAADSFIYLTASMIIIYILMIDEYAYRRYLLRELKDYSIS